MMRLPEWLRPPGTLLLGLFLLTLVSVSALAWFSWRFVEQERLVETQRSQQHLEETTDRLATQLRGAMAETADRLSAGESHESGILLLFDGAKSLRTQPPGKLLYLPFDDGTERSATEDSFAEAEMFEFVQHAPGQAIRLYQRLAAQATDANTRAGALLRLARVLRATGKDAESRAVWQRLATTASPSVTSASIPVQLAALLEVGDIAAALDGMRAGRWRLTHTQFDFYWDTANKLGHKNEQPPPEARAISEAAARVWQFLSVPDAPGRGQDILWAASRPWLVVWRSVGEQRAVLLASAEGWLRVAAGSNFSDLQIALIDGQGRTVAGRRVAPANGRAVIRPAIETQLPWAIYAVSAGSGGGTGAAMRRRYLLSGVAVMACFLLLGTYFVARAIRREAEVARMQSDFVSSVSHEFRSPLTTMRQLSEILALGRVPSEDRRQLYYETLVRETKRLQRVVEALLKFGQMESGASKYRFETIEVADVVQHAVADVQQQITGPGRHIDVRQPSGACTVQADQEAIAVALRNLLDNAVKYSPDSTPVILEWSRRNGHVAIAVSDEGPGVGESEQRLIFQKFVRGSAASSGNVKGSGLGLAMVRHIVAAHRGEVKLDSRPGKGSTFTILLPASEEQG